LNLTEAFAQLQGDFNPYLRAVAVTESGGTSISFVLEGVVSSLAVAISSSPSLPEDEILSRLLFGRALTKILALQALQIAAAVNTLAGGGGAGIVSRLRDKFGLDDLDVSTSDTGETGVRVGKYITQNIYSDVTVDSAGNSEINLNLSVTPSVTARGTLKSDGNSGLGLFFEKDY
jgi:translocation and assembly module TamB